MRSRAAALCARSARTAPAVRCAVYTRKSSEEGLEQEFNSLHAQREACEAYITSQRHEGWQCLAEAYDDGGISGGTMDRPGLKRLLADVEAGLIDTVVVYKVDRLTRSLSDFAKIVDVFDAAGASFVSVTQSFNTTTSMGRLTLNMLLSFAQFEREVTSERIRDKIAASKRKGMWTGGSVPLGYDAIDTKLVVNEPEAGTVRAIYELYLECGTVRDVREALAEAGYVGKPKRDADRTVTEPGRPFAHDGPIYHLLQNRLYHGQIAYRGEVHDGQHEAIVSEELFDAVQAKLQANRVKRSYGSTAKAPALLAGLIVDEHGQAVSPTHSNKAGKRYRYYASQSLIGRKAKGRAGVRIPSGDLDGLVLGRLKRFFADRRALHDVLLEADAETRDYETLLAAGSAMADATDTLTDHERRALAQVVVGRIMIRPDRVDIVLRNEGVLTLLEKGSDDALETALPISIFDDYGSQTDQTDTDSKALTILTVPASIRRAGTEMRLVLQDGSAGDGDEPKPDPSLVRLIAQAHLMRRMLIDHDGRSIAELALQIGLPRTYFSRIVRLGFLAPDITEAILDGTQPITLTAASLAHCQDLPSAWVDQRAMLGFAAI